MICDISTIHKSKNGTKTAKPAVASSTSVDEGRNHQLCVGNWPISSQVRSLTNQTLQFLAKSMRPWDGINALLALEYPAAAKAIALHGAIWDRDENTIDDLDWTAMLTALHADGFIIPGPSVGGVSFWYTTTRCHLDFMTTFAAAVQKIVGNGWTPAVLHRFERHIFSGPRLRNWRYEIAHRVGPQRTREPSIIHAFRPLDEAPRWTRRSRRDRRVSGRVPRLWEAIPWFVPSGLEERDPQSDHGLNVTSPKAPKEAATKEYVDEIVSFCTLDTTAINEVIGCIDELKISRKSPRHSDAILSYIDNAIAALWVIVDRKLLNAIKAKEKAANAAFNKAEIFAEMVELSRHFHDEEMKKQHHPRAVALLKRQVDIDKSKESTLGG